MWAIMKVNVNCQITMPHDLGIKSPPKNVAQDALPPKIIWAHTIIYALLLLYVTDYRVLGHFRLHLKTLR